MAVYKAFFCTASTDTPSDCMRKATAPKEATAIILSESKPVPDKLNMEQKMAVMSLERKNIARDKLRELREDNKSEVRI